MLGEAKNQCFFTRAALSRGGRAKRIFLSFLFFFPFCGGAWAQIFIQLGTPQDSPEVRRAVADREELKRPAEECHDLIQTRLCGLKLAEVQRIFGPRLEYHPGNLVLPIFVPPGVGMSGARPGGTPDNRHTDRHAVGDIGYADFYYGFDGESVAAVVLWNRADRVAAPNQHRFVPLRSVADLPERLAWDLQQFQDLKKWLDEHLAKVTDLGVIELEHHTPVCLHLEAGEDYRVTAEITSPSAYWVYVWGYSQDQRDFNKPGASTHINGPNQSVVFSAGGKLYRLMPKLLTQPKAVDLGPVELAYDVETRLDLGEGRECRITATKVKAPGSGSTIDLYYHSPKDSRGLQTWVPDPGSVTHFPKEIAFPLDAIIFSFTPVIKTPSSERQTR